MTAQYPSFPSDTPGSTQVYSALTCSSHTSWPGQSGTIHKSQVLTLDKVVIDFGNSLVDGYLWPALEYVT